MRGIIILDIESYHEHFNASENWVKFSKSV